MNSDTLPQMARTLEKYIVTLPKAKHFNTLSSGPRGAMMALTETSYLLRTSAQHYFHADDTTEQRQYLDVAIEQAALLQQYILAASQHDLLDPADVAHLSALTEQITERLR